MFAATSNFTMNKTGGPDDLYSSIINLINTREYEKAQQLFNSRNANDMLFPNQIPALSSAINSGSMNTESPSFYYQISVFLSIYCDALKGTLASNDYINSFHKRS